MLCGRVSLNPYRRETQTSRTEENVGVGRVAGTRVGGELARVL